MPAVTPPAGERGAGGAGASAEGVSDGRRLSCRLPRSHRQAQGHVWALILLSKIKILLSITLIRKDTRVHHRVHDSRDAEATHVSTDGRQDGGEVGQTRLGAVTGEVSPVVTTRTDPEGRC